MPCGRNKTHNISTQTINYMLFLKEVPLEGQNCPGGISLFSARTQPLILMMTMMMMINNAELTLFFRFISLNTLPSKDKVVPVLN
jgi:hypothetical protein